MTKLWTILKTLMFIFPDRHGTSRPWNFNDYIKKLGLTPPVTVSDVHSRLKRITVVMNGYVMDQNTGDRVSNVKVVIYAGNNYNTDSMTGDVLGIAFTDSNGNFSFNINPYTNEEAIASSYLSNNLVVFGLCFYKGSDLLVNYRYCQEQELVWSPQFNNDTSTINLGGYNVIIQNQPPSPPKQVSVPNVLNMLLSKAIDALNNVNLNHYITNPGLYTMDSVKVVNQSPVGGSMVNEGGGVQLTVGPLTGGIKGYRLHNTSDRSSLDIYLWDSKTNSWSNKGTLTTSNTVTLSFESNVVYTFEAMDPGQKPPGDRPYWEQDGIGGDAGGQVLDYYIN